MMFLRSIAIGRLVAGVALIPAAVAAGPYDPPEPGPRFDPGAVEAWRESEVQIPAYPDDRHLLAVTLGPTDTVRLYVDERSISRGTDGVARFTLVIESARGARNVFYEGLRCETREYKTYALGAPGRILRPVKDPRWQAIAYHATNAFRFHLYQHYVCHEGTARAPRELVQAIRAQASSTESRTTMSTVCDSSAIEGEAGTSKESGGRAAGTGATSAEARMALAGFPREPWMAERNPRRRAPGQGWTGRGLSTGETASPGRAT